MPKIDYKPNKEARIIEKTLELRADEQEQGKMILEGYAAVFNEETQIGPVDSWGWYETIDRHAFDETDTKDCCLKFNHGDTKGVLARTKNGSLKLTIDDKGLKIRAELIDTTDNIDVYKKVRAGLYDQMSFAFTIAKGGDDITQNKDGTIRRVIRKVAKLWDCAVVDVPAYDGTSIYARSKEIVGERLRNLQPSVESDEATLENVEKKSSELELEKVKIEVLYGKEN